jgi:hypothetical protein
MSVGTALAFITANWEMIKDVAILAVALWGLTSSSARCAIAAVFEILKDSQGMTAEQALQKASDLMGKKFPYIPEALRKMIIQWCFDSMKKAVSPEKK